VSNAIVPRKPNGQLLPGHPPLPGGGRPKGRKNTKTLTMLEMMKAAAVEKHGSVDAFLATVMDQDPVFFAAQMIRATVPAAKEPDPAAARPTVCKVFIQPIASGTYVSREACEHLTRTGQLPPDALITLIEPGATMPELAAPATGENPAESDALAVGQGSVS
jgi:hypothetical protein